MNKELIKLISDNPDLPIFAWVDAEICGDSYGYWLGKFSSAEIREYAELDFTYGYHDTNWVFKDDTEELIEYLVNLPKYVELTDEEANNKAEEFINNLEYKKAIFVWVSF